MISFPPASRAATAAASPAPPPPTITISAANFVTASPIIQNLLIFIFGHAKFNTLAVVNFKDFRKPENGHKIGLLCS
jgi:hypothetical protein